MTDYLDEPDRTGPGGRPRDAALDGAILRATRRRLVVDGYSKMTIKDITADAKVGRNTLRRRWKNKFDLVVDALDYGFRTQGNLSAVDLDRLEPIDALIEAVRYVDPASYSADAMMLIGNLAAESIRTPELMNILREHVVRPRVEFIQIVLTQLRARGAVRADIDVHTISTLCFGSYFASYYRGEMDAHIPEDVVTVLWPTIAGRRTSANRRSTARAGRDG
ncbi:TetR/AcrR family transcriptional regulator C-terminal ligand-binding domain-containing protein [Amycolatopsis sp. NPDC051372]